MKQRIWTRFLSLLLAACLILGLAPTAIHASPAGPEVRFEEISPEEVSADLRMDQRLPNPEQETHNPDEQVRVSIVLEDAPVLDKGYSTMGLAANRQAIAYRHELLANQQAVQLRISSAIGQELDVAWNLTLAANIISANVRYGDMEKIAATKGVAKVVPETRYEPCTAEEGDVQPNMASATTMTGSNLAWQAGYTGAGSRVAIIDTGLDTDHQSVDNGAFLYALGEEAGSLNLLDEEEIASVLPQLNIYKGYKDPNGNFIKDEALTAEKLHLSDKVPFGYNYVDRTLDITHDNDPEGAHGSHVAGIAAANRYIPEGNGYVDAAEATHMTGAAPDAQILVMKVFGKNGGAYDSDYMAAIEDAIVLGADVVNLSLGSAYSGFATSIFYQSIMDSLVNSDTVVAVSAGNNDSWPAQSARGYLYAEDVNYHTGGSPGTFANSFTVASVDNCGVTGLAFRVNGQAVVYRETLSSNIPFNTLNVSEDGNGTELPYVFLNGLGKPEDYAGINVSGKVVFISRGETNFSDKLTAASNAGAAACIIYNNVPGMAISMDLTGSSARIPCVSISQNDADAIRAASKAVADGAGNVQYYTGTMIVDGKTATSILESDYDTMSSFSSWGVPGNLTLKPEITAPGGNIYSIDGAGKNTDRYVLMSGTSMAAPHLAGLTALMSQYYRETGLAEELGVSPRVLSQSLLMSTATPIVDGASGLPYPVIQQGAGLVNVFDAMSASSYVLVDGQPDGKVKAELGDDPNRSGIYSFDFTLNNMTDEAQLYTLEANAYTQDSFWDDGIWYADYTMSKLGAGTTFTVDGKEILPQAEGLMGCDFNGDGKINESDSQALLDYAVGKASEIQNEENADLNGDRRITAYDAELFLTRLGKHTLELPASGSAKVSVTITLTEEDKALLDRRFESGAYIEAYVTATPMATSEGMLASGHSIPVLAFYGGWDEASMFDHVTRTQLVAGSNQRESYFPQGPEGPMAYNCVGVTYGDDEQVEMYLGGNSFAVDEQYLPQRNAIRSNSGDAITSMIFSLIRNAALIQGSITNAETGETYYEASYEYVPSAYFVPAYNTWMNVVQGLNPDWYVTDTKGNPLADGTTLNLTLRAANQYCTEQNGTVNWSDLDPGSTSLTLPVAVDNVAPVLKAVSTGERKDINTGATTKFMEASVQDNRYTAALLLLTADGKRVISRQAANQTELGVETAIRVDITDISGAAFKLAMLDYAGNASYYDVTIETSPDDPDPPVPPVPAGALYGAAFGYGHTDWNRISPNDGYKSNKVGTIYKATEGAAYGDGYVFYSATQLEGVPFSTVRYLYVMDYPKFEDPICIGKLLDGNTAVKNLTYSTDEQCLYFTSQNMLYAIDVATAEATLAAYLDTGEYQYSGLAYSQEEHCFYSVGYAASPNGLYTIAMLRFTLPENPETTVTPEVVADLGFWTDMGGTLTLDEKNNSAYILCRGTYGSTLKTFDFATKELKNAAMLEDYVAIILPDDSTADNSIIRTEPTSISLNTDTLNVFQGHSRVLAADLAPWCLENKGITWKSSNPNVASVDGNGVVTGISSGTATITATSVQDTSFSADCTVCVIGNDFTFQGVSTTDQESQLFTYDLSKNAATMGKTIENTSGVNILAEAATDSGDGKVWVWDNQVDEDGNGYRMHIIDPVTGKSSFDSDPCSCLYQQTSAHLTDVVYDDHNGILLGVNGSKDGILFTEDPSANGMDLYDIVSGDLLAITKGESWEEEDIKYTAIYILDVTRNYLIRGALSYFESMESWTFSFLYYDLDKTLNFVPDANGVYQESLTYDSVTGTPILFHYTPDGTEIYALSLDRDALKASVISLGTMQMDTEIALYSATYNGSAIDPVTSNAAAEGNTNPQMPVSSQKENPPQGATNVAFGTPERQSNGIVTVTVKAEETAASGMMELFLDENLTLVSLESPAQFSSYTQRDGKVVFGYAGTEAIAKDDVVAVLQLKNNSEKSILLALETERSGKIVNTATIITVSTDSCNGGQGCPSAAFSDLDTKAWYHEYTDFALEQELMQGIGGGKFAPNGAVSRAMAVTVLYRMAGSPEVQQTAPFSDVSENAWYAKAVAWAYENGIVKGVSEGLFAPNQAAAREQLAAFLYRYAGFCGMDLSVQGDLSAFSDGNAVSSYAKDAVSWAVGRGLLVGTPDGKLSPQDSAVRVQLAALIFRFSED